MSTVNWGYYNIYYNTGSWYIGNKRYIHMKTNKLKTGEDRVNSNAVWLPLPFYWSNPKEKGEQNESI